MGAQGFFALFAKWSSPIWRSCKKRQCVSHCLGKLVAHLCKTIFAWLYSITCKWDLTSESWFCMKTQIFNPETPRCSSGISANSWHFMLRKGTPQTAASVAVCRGSSLKASSTLIFFLCSSSVHLIPASSCGVATPRTPISAKQRKGLRWTGPCVHQERWELLPCVPTCTRVFMCVCVQLGMFPSKSRGTREEPVWRTWGLLRCGANSWVQVKCWALAQLVRAWC